MNERIRLMALANKAFTTSRVTTEEVVAFASFVAAAECEECAKVCDGIQKKNEDEGAWMWEAKNCAATIRARGQHD